jgi:hypothetical protein
VSVIQQQHDDAATVFSDISSVTSNEPQQDDADVFDDELELSDYLLRRSMEWVPADSESSQRRQSGAGNYANLQDEETLLQLMEGEGKVLNLTERELFYITLPESPALGSIRTLDLKGNSLTECPLLSSLPLLEVLILDNNFITSRSTFHSAPLLHTLWLNHNIISNIAPLAASLNAVYPKLKYLSTMFNPCHPSVLPGADERSFRQYRLLVITLLPNIEDVDSVKVDAEETSIVRSQLAGPSSLSDVNVLDAVDIERLQPYLNPLKLRLPYPSTIILEGTVTLETSGLLPSKNKVYLRLSIAPCTSGPCAHLPLLSWAAYSQERCPTVSEVESNGLPGVLFESDCVTVALVPGFKVAPTKKPRDGFKSIRIDWSAGESRY